MAHFEIAKELERAWAAEDDLKKAFESPHMGPRGGMSGRLLEDGTPVGSSEQSCPRRALLRSREVEPKIDLRARLTFMVGFSWERAFESIAKSPRVSEAQVDAKVSKGSFAGSIDLLAKVDGVLTVFELKSISSLGSYEKTLSLFTVPDSYISQCVSYMLAVGAPQGYIVFYCALSASSSYMTAGAQRRLGTVKPTIRQVFIQVDKESIWVDGNWYAALEGIKEHQRVVYESIQSGKPYPIRPRDRDRGSLCAWCPFQKACAAWELDNSLDFIELSKQCLKETSND